MTARNGKEWTIIELPIVISAYQSPRAAVWGIERRKRAFSSLAVFYRIPPHRPGVINGHLTRVDPVNREDRIVNGAMCDSI
jgi:hypothetical protein